jgi:outer membrane protein OmpA-like peptidoglycan-associated protein
MIQKELNEENKEIRARAYELYREHGFHDGNEFVDWLEAEKQSGKRSRAQRDRQTRGLLLTIVGMLCIIVAILLFTLLKRAPTASLSEVSASQLKVVMLVLDPQADEKVVVFGDTHFAFGKAALTEQAKAALDKDVQVLKDNPKMRVRMAGYTSAMGTEAINQALSESRAGTVRSYLVERGIAAERITVVGYGRTKPAVYEVNPGNINSKEAKANMRVLFEVVVNQT